MKKHLKAALAALAEAQLELEACASLPTSALGVPLWTELMRTRTGLRYALDGTANMLAMLRELEAEGRAVKALP